ncbi:MAG: uroporphyrinogen-III synthase, partial [Candidatus Solibacter sp.]|nr:uroporphyrinogen-III synthase [Candidatus Solibacter sp.]
MGVAGRKMLLARAAKARDILPEGLRELGAEVDVVEAYRTVKPREGSRRLRELLSEASVDAITFTSNAAAYAGALGDTTSLTVPVDLEVVSAGPPVLDFQGVQDNATFVPGDPVAPGDIVAVKGQQLSAKDGTQAGAPPIATQLTDTQVLFNGQPLPL